MEPKQLKTREFGLRLERKAAMFAHGGLEFGEETILAVRHLAHTGN
jgi:hypothetical protein